MKNDCTKNAPQYKFRLHKTVIASLSIVFCFLLPATAFCQKQQADTAKIQQVAARLKQPVHAAKKPVPAAGSHTAFTYKVINAANGTFGYDVFANGRMVIHQPYMPCVAGKKGFKSSADAKKVAELVTGKIKNGQMPAVKITELKALNVLG